MRLPAGLKSAVKREAPLEKLTTFRIGGPAELLVSPAGTGELRQLILFFRRNSLPVRVIGGGSNILASDNGVRGVVLRLDRGPFRSVRVRGERVFAGAGVPLASLLRLCGIRGLGGLEFLAGIPGSIGGALAMNCGVSTGTGTRSIGDAVEQVRVIGYDGVVSVKTPAKGLVFRYRSSGLSRFVITGARFNLRRADPRQVRREMKEWILRRRGQEYRFPSAGCVFKNPSPASPAGKLIDECGLKGRAVGGARVSDRHANFIVNAGSASCADVLALMRIVRREVERKRGIRLEPEIKIWK